MRSSHVYARALATSFIAFAMGLAFVPTASADPNDATQTDPPAPAPGPGPAAVATQQSDDGGAPAATACKTFAVALNVAANNYSEFANSIAGGGDNVNYQAPQVTDANVTGRTALREAAGAAMDASNTPGLSPDISAPMAAWSLHATKLLLVMGLHGGGDTLNSTATELNTDAHNTQLACAAAGTPALSNRF